jgi:hypothetical protein
MGKDQSRDERQDRYLHRICSRFMNLVEEEEEEEEEDDGHREQGKRREGESYRERWLLESLHI